MRKHKIIHVSLLVHTSLLWAIWFSMTASAQTKGIRGLKRFKEDILKSERESDRISFIQNRDLQSNNLDDESNNDFNGPPITFYVMGDVPYSDKELEALPLQLADVPNDAKFIVHVGDVNKPSVDNCSEHIFSSVSGIFRKSAYPLFMVPGDNDWLDCPNHTEAWTLWENNFGSLDDNWNISFPVTRQTGRNENFAFFLDGALFIGINVNKQYIYSREEREERVADARNWVIGNIQEFREHLTSLVIFAHDRIRSNYDDLFEPLAEELKSLGIPALYIHGNGHKFLTADNDRDSQLLRVQVDRGGIAPPLKVTIHENGLNPFEFDRRL